MSTAGTWRLRTPVASSRLVVWTATDRNDPKAADIATSPTITAGEGVPTHTEPLGSIYLRTDGTGFSTILYTNTDGAATWGAGVGPAVTDTISESTPAAGVTVDGVLLKDASVYTSTIVEGTPTAGVMVDGVLLRDGGIDITGPLTSTPGGGAVLTRTYVDSGEQSVNTGADVTAIALNIPVGANLIGAACIILDPITGVSSSGVTVTAAFGGGSTAPIGTLVSSGDGNLAANTKAAKLYSYADSTAVSGSVADFTLTFSGGADNIPSGGTVRCVAYYETLDAFLDV